MGILDMFEMVGNHDERKIDTYKKDSLFIDTCRVTDSEKPFETAAAHPDYNDGDMVIVELYDTPEEAQQGHDKWLDKMLNNPPRQLVDVSSAWATNMLRSLGGLPAREKQA